MSDDFNWDSEATKLRKAQRAEAKHQAERERARASQKAAVKKADASKPKTDAEIMRAQAKAGGPGPGEKPGEAAKVGRPAEVKGKPTVAKPRPTVDVNADTKVNLEPKPTQSAGSPAGARAAKPRTVFNGLAIPQGDTKVFDFEAKPEGKIQSTMNDMPTETNLAPKAKAKLTSPITPKITPATAAPKPPTKVADIPKLVMRPQGSMEGKPVEPVIDRRGNWAERKPGGTPPEGMAERRAPATTEIGGGKAMNATGTVEAPKPTAVADDYASMRAQNRTTAHIAPSADPDVAKAMRASMTSRAHVAPPGASLGERVAGRVGRAASSKVGKAFVALGRDALSPILDPIADVKKFIGGHAERAAAHQTARAAAETATGLRGRVAARAGQAMAMGRTAGAATLLGGRLALGAGKVIGEGVAAGAVWGIAAQGEKARQESAVDIHNLQSQGAKQGLKVTAREPSVLKMMAGMGPNIKVEDPSQKKDASGTSLSDRRRARGEAKNKAMAAAKPAAATTSDDLADENSEAYYNKLKKSASRSIIKGSSAV
jgi:hypothetical protein